MVEWTLPTKNCHSDLICKLSYSQIPYLHPMFSSPLKTELAADKIISFDETKKQFIISYNYPYLKKYAFIFLLIGIILATLCGLYMQSSFLMGAVLLSVTGFPFITLGGRLLYMSFQKQKIIIDLESKKILFNKNLTIPFHSISQFSLVKERYYDVEYPVQFLKMKKVTSWLITIEDFKANKVVLCKSDNEEQAIRIVKGFSNAMHVKLQPITEPGE